MTILRDQRLRIFHAVASTKSFSEAARHLNVTQQAVSFQIRSLEQDIGLELFVRHHHTNDLTIAGQILFVHAEKILALYEEALTSLREVSRKSKTTLRIAATSSIAKYKLPKTINVFKQRFPDVSVIVEIGNSAYVMSCLSRGTVEIGLTSDGAPDLDQYRVSPYLRDEILFVVSPDHPWNKLQEVPLADLVKTPFILREEGSGTRALLQRHLATRSLSLEMLNTALTLGSAEAVKESAEAGMGVGIISGLCAKQSIESQKLIAKEIQNLKIVRDFYLVRPPKGLGPSVIDDFLSVAREPGIT